jgi:S-DNA-T family DNA segregation ATPase FtsK/SpoIIIE
MTAESDHPEEILWAALSAAPEEGWEVGDLMSITGMTRTTLYRYLRELVSKGRAYQVSRGRWRARTPRGRSR